MVVLIKCVVDCTVICLQLVLRNKQQTQRNNSLSETKSSALFCGYARMDLFPSTLLTSVALQVNS